jgi:hypothetical protein
MPTAILKAPKFSAERLGQCLGALLGTLVSPGWYCTRLVLAHYLPNSLLTHQGPSMTSLLDLLKQLNALDPTLLMMRIIPLLLLCQVLALGFLYLCGHLGRRLADYIAQKRRSIPA